MTSPQIVLLAIQSAVKFGAQMRAAYVDATRNRELVLPLPDFKPGGNPVPAASYLLKKQITAPGRLRDLLDKINRSNDNVLDPEEEKELIRFHREHLIMDLPDRGPPVKTDDQSSVPVRSLKALVTVRQWEHDPNPSALQRLAGSLIEIAVDYFVGPGAEKLTSRHAGAMKAVLSGLDKIDFSIERLDDLPQKLFTIALETATTHPQLFSEDANTQALIGAATRGLLTDVDAHIVASRSRSGEDSVKEERIRSLGEVVFHSLLSSTGTLLLREPERFLGIQPGAQSALVSSVGNAALALVLNATDGTPTGRFTREGLESIAGAALKVVARYPELATDNGKLKALVSQLATDLSQTAGVLDSAALPAVMRLILERTAENLPSLWPDAGHPERHLALVAARTALDILLRTPVETDHWQIEFGREEALAVVDKVLDDLVRNPGWLVKKASLNSHLKTALTGIVAVLRERGDARLSGQLALGIILSGLEAAASRSEFLDDLNEHDDTPIVAAAIDTILAIVFAEAADPKVVWRMLREEVMLELVDTALKKLAQSKLDPGRIIVLAGVVETQVANIEAGDVWSVADFALQLAARLKS